MAAAQPVDIVRELRGVNRLVGIFVGNSYLSVEDVYRCLKNQLEGLSEAGKKTVGYIERTIPDQFLQLGITFPVTRLQHVTTEIPTRQIVQLGYFCAGDQSRLPWSHPNAKLLYWSVEILKDQIEELRQEAFQALQAMVPPHNAEEFEGVFNRQFANSPAFNADASRYGNFKFSLSLSDFMSEYKEQHCQGAEPEFRVLGTAMYEEEIAHIVLVHSPMTTEFSDLPSVPIVGRNANPLPFVFRSQEDGKLYWRPESTADILKMRISEKQCRKRDCPVSCPDCDHGQCAQNRGTYCVWNHLIFVFHLPENEPLRIPREKLRESLSACEVLSPYLRRAETRLTRPTAEEIIRSLEI
uniref:Uncharacterized protein n=1 Tax=Xenopus tropicalis TaxID=8364 RepID=A0A1B8Y4K7_XENTR|eukprot:XP_004919483.1 PREDICTED: uncharacterized protein LOC101733852 [Xenopus tropicalis]